MKRLIIYLAVILISVPVIAKAQGTFDGIIFGDYYYAAEHHLDDIEDQNGLVIRRIYFRYR